MNKCLVLGLGISGKAALKTLISRGKYVMVTDKYTPEELDLDESDREKIRMFYLGQKEAEKRIEEFDTLIKSPGISFEDEIVTLAYSKGLTVIDELELGYRFLKSKTRIVAVTGTNGKTTTTTMLGRLFKTAGYRCHVAGNIGDPISSFADTVEKGDIVVAEISSFQLEGIIDFKPDIAILLNFAPDHIDRHKNFENYIKAKARIFENQKQDDVAILNLDDENCLKLSKRLRSRTLYFSRRQQVFNGAQLESDKLVMKQAKKSIEVISRDEIEIPGEHNIENILALLCVSNSLELSTEITRKAINEFEGVEHRLERIGQFKGITFFNDSKATNVKASITAIEALKSYGHNSPLVIILGGMDKGEKFDELVMQLLPIEACAIVFGETVAKWSEVFKKHGFRRFIKVDSLSKAVEKAFEMANNEGTVLFSPACASWDMFNNFEERGKLFKNEVYKRGGKMIDNKRETP